MRRALAPCVLHDPQDLCPAPQAANAEHRVEQRIRRGLPGRGPELVKASKVDELYEDVAGIPNGAEQFRMQRAGEVPGGGPAGRGVHGEDETLRGALHRWLYRRRFGQELVDPGFR